MNTTTNSAAVVAVEQSTRQLGLSWSGLESSKAMLDPRKANIGVFEGCLHLLGVGEAVEDWSTGTLDDYQECPLASFGADAVYEPSLKQLSIASSSFQGNLTAAQSLPTRFENAMQNLHCSPADLKELAENERHFNLLKRSLRKNGAVTNEVLKQKLPLFLSFSRSGRRLTNGQSGASAA